MAHEFDHVHLKAPDPEKTANWYVEVFGFKIVSDTVRVFGDRFGRCETQNGVIVNVSGARSGETLGPSDPNVHFGLEHFGFAVEDIDGEIERLTGLGAKLQEGPTALASGRQIAFIEAPDQVRIELGTVEADGPGLDHVHLRAPDPERHPGLVQEGLRLHRRQRDDKPRLRAVDTVSHRRRQNGHYLRCPGGPDAPEGGRQRSPQS